MAPQRKRLVVCLPSDEAQMRLPPCHPVDLEWVHGGVRTLHELAFAAAAAGWRVELRGWVERSVFAGLAECGCSVPDQPPDARAPDADDVILLPVGHADPLAYLGAWLSGAQLVLAALSPLGMLGWPFVDGWQRPSHLTLTADEVNRPEHFAAIADMSIAVWTHSELAASAARAAGVHVAGVGQGTPHAYPDPAPRRPTDVVWLANNRWATLAEPVATRITGVVAEIGVASHAEMLRRLGEAKILLYPGQVEGEPRITREARAMGAVPVVVRHANPYSDRLTEEHGVIAVETLDDMPAAIEALLGDPDRWNSLSERAISTARAESAWEPYVTRVRRALDTLPEHDFSRGARAGLGERLREQLQLLVPALGESRQRGAELEAELVRVTARNVELEEEFVRVLARKDECEAALRQTRNELDRAGSRRVVGWPARPSELLRRVTRRAG